MFNLIPASLLIAAMGGIVYIISNHLSEMNGNNDKDDFNFNLRARFIDWVNQLPIDSVKSQSLSLTQKSLHRLRLFLLKSDNFLMKLIGKISQHEKSMNGNNNKASNNPVDFWSDFSRNQEEKQTIIPAAEPEIKINLAVKKTLKIKKSSK